MVDSGRSLQETGLIDLVDLDDFDVQLARLDNTAIQTFELTDIVTEWLNGSFEAQLEQLGYTKVYANFDTVIILERKAQRLLTEEAEPTVQMGELFTAKYKGAALFTRNATQETVPPDVVTYIQEAALTNKTGLLALLQLSTAAGLGASVVDINAYSVSNAPATDDQGSLEAIIIIAVVVAAVAFIFLLLAIFWAWRYDRRNREAYLVGKAAEARLDPTGSNSTLEDHTKSRKHKNAPVSEIGGDSVVGGGVYPESVISEDISTSLSQYYRSGLGNYSASAFIGRSGRMDHLNDAASVSSMDSYGYSLDGYAPTITTMPIDIPIPSEPAPEPDDDLDDDEDAAELDESKF